MSLWNRIRTVCTDLSPNCREAVRAHSESLDHPLPPTRRLGLSMHLLLCGWCRRYSRQIDLLHDTTRQQSDNLVPPTTPGLSADARDRIKQRLRQGR